MAESRRVVNLLGAAGVALFALTGGALADGYEGSIKDAPAAPAREFTYSFGVTGTSDYVFRGQTQTDGDPTIQGTINLGYGILYGGVWASGLDFGGGADGIGSDAEIEVDWYGGIKPTWGKATFDFGVIYYTYPGASDSILELDYVELKAGVSGEVFDKLTAGATVYYSPEYTGETGESWVFEGAWHTPSRRSGSSHRPSAAHSATLTLRSSTIGTTGTLACRWPSKRSRSTSAIGIRTSRPRECDLQQRRPVRLRRAVRVLGFRRTALITCAKSELSTRQRGREIGPVLRQLPNF